MGLRADPVELFLCSYGRSHRFPKHCLLPCLQARIQHPFQSKGPLPLIWLLSPQPLCGDAGADSWKAVCQGSPGNGFASSGETSTRKYNKVAWDVIMDLGQKTCWVMVVAYAVSAACSCRRLLAWICMHRSSWYPLERHKTQSSMHLLRAESHYSK